MTCSLRSAKKNANEERTVNTLKSLSRFQNSLQTLEKTAETFFFFFFFTPARRIMNAFLIWQRLLGWSSHKTAAGYSETSLPVSQVQAENPGDMFKISSSSTLAVIVHICIDGLAVISLGWYAGYVVWGDINFSTHSVSLCLFSSLSISPTCFHLSSAVVGWSATIFKVALDLWEYSSLSNYGWPDPDTLLLYRGTGEHVRYRFTRTLSLLGVWQIYNIVGKKAISPVSMEV